MLKSSLLQTSSSTYRPLECLLKDLPHTFFPNPGQAAKLVLLRVTARGRQAFAWRQDFSHRALLPFRCCSGARCMAISSLRQHPPVSSTRDVSSVPELSFGHLAAWSHAKGCTLRPSIMCGSKFLLRLLLAGIHSKRGEKYS